MCYLEGLSVNGRYFTRVDYSVGASIKYDNNVIMCKTDNLCLHGMFLQTDHDIPENIPVHVTVYHSSQASLKVTGRVVRREPKGVGVQINNLNISSFVQLRNIVAEQSREHGQVMQETYKMLKCIY
jgi:hypothetical protein